MNAKISDNPLSRQLRSRLRGILSKNTDPRMNGKQTRKPASRSTGGLTTRVHPQQTRNKPAKLINMRGKGKMAMKLCACGCGRPISENSKGRPGKYASTNCRVNAFRQRQEVTKVPDDVTKCTESVLTELQSELLSIGQSISYQRVILVSDWGHVSIEPSLVGWARYALSEKEERLGSVVRGVRRYAGHLIKAGLAGDDTTVTKVPDGVTKVPDAPAPPKCSAIYDDMTRHVPNTREPGAYDLAGNYWCADCRERLEVMNRGAQLEWPEISYFPQNPEGMRSVQIKAGYEQWCKRLPVMSKPDASPSWDNIRYQLQRLERAQATTSAQHASNRRSKGSFQNEENHVDFNLPGNL